MAIDTRDKRASMIALALPFGRVYPNPPDYTASKGNRQQNNRLFAGVETTPIITWFNGLGTQRMMTGFGQ